MAGKSSRKIHDISPCFISIIKGSRTQPMIILRLSRLKKFLIESPCLTHLEMNPTQPKKRETLGTAGLCSSPPCARPLPFFLLCNQLYPILRKSLLIWNTCITRWQWIKWAHASQHDFFKYFSNCDIQTDHRRILFKCRLGVSKSEVGPRILLF